MQKIALSGFDPESTVVSVVLFMIGMKFAHPPGYEPGALPLRHKALLMTSSRE
jgi:hypothetical protein